MQNVTASLRLLCGGTLLAALLMLTACDSSDPVAVDPSEVQGTYDFTEYTFDPTAGVIPEYDMLDTLTSINLQLVAGGVFVLQYQFEGASSLVAATGNYTVTEDEVRMVGNESNAAQFEAILLEREFALERTSAEVLTDEQGKTVDLSAFSEVYQGLPPVEGRLLLRLALR
jgi:hypothetical protein